MTSGRTLFGRLVMVVLLAVCGLVPVACASTGCAQPLTVIGNWGGAEEAAFNQVLDEFNRESGCTALYHGSQSLDQELQADVQQGDPPDIAMLSSPGQLESYAAQGDLRPFSVDSKENTAYPPQWRQLENELRPTTDSDLAHQYAIVFKADLKSAVWYDPKAMGLLPAWTGPPGTWAQLTALTSTITKAGGQPWCLGLEATPNSGWPGTDWIEDILLHQSGVTAYQDWANGGSWTAAPVVQAWTTWGALLAAQHDLPYNPASGVAQDPLLTNFNDAGTPMFGRPAGCYLDHKASFIMGTYQNDTLPGSTRSKPRHPQPSTDYAFFPFPSLGASGPAYEVSADIATMFRSSPAAEKLMAFLASDQAQRIWPSRATGSAFSVDSNVPLSTYTDKQKQGVATILTRTGGALCFDAADLMSPSMSNAFNQAVVKYLIDPTSLQTLLTGLNQLQSQEAGRNSQKFSCGVRP